MLMLPLVSQMFDIYALSARSDVNVMSNMGQTDGRTDRPMQLTASRHVSARVIQVNQCRIKTRARRRNHWLQPYVAQIIYLRTGYLLTVRSTRAVHAVAFCMSVPPTQKVGVLSKHRITQITLPNRLATV